MPSNGSLSGSGANLRYTPFGNFAGSDSFEFRVRDDTGTEVTGIVSITVIAVATPSAVAPIQVPQVDSTPTQPTPLATVQATGSDLGESGGTPQSEMNSLQPPMNDESPAVPASTEPTVNRGLRRPVLYLPSGIATSSSPTPSFTWSVVEEAVAYQIQITSTTSFLYDLVENAFVQETTHISTSLEAGVYLWRVRSLDANGDASLWSDVRMLTILRTPLLTESS